MPKKKTIHPFASDQPITRLKDDKLGRDKFAENIARAMMAWSGENSLVVAIYGGWGDGKSSVKGMMADVLRKHRKRSPIITEFNPWEWAGQNQIAGAFFEEIGKQIGLEGSDEAKQAERRIRQLGNCVAATGSFVKKVGGLVNWIAPGTQLITDAFGEGAQKAASFSGQVADALEAQIEITAKSLPKLKQELKTALLKLDKKVLVFVDDIDRLAADEIKLLFQLIKANADFPNLIFCVLFQRDIVEKSLEETIKVGTGREYLEKIVQVGFDLPQIPRATLDGFLAGRLETVLKTHSVLNEFDWQRWTEEYLDAYRSFFTNLRDVYRFFGTFEFHLSAFVGKSLEINPIDFFALEILRVFEPKAYRIIANGKNTLFEVSTEQIIDYYDLSSLERTSKVRGLLLDQMPQEGRERVAKLVECLFPNLPDGSQAHLQRELRICKEEFFDRYFQLCIPEGDVAQAELNEVISVCGNREQLAGKIRELNSRLLSYVVLNRLLAYAVYFKEADTESFASGLFDVGDELAVTESKQKWPRDLSTLSYLLVNSYLRGNQNPEIRFLRLKTCISVSTGVYLPALQVEHERFRIRNKEQQNLTPDDCCVLSESHLKELQSLCAEKIQRAAQHGSIQGHPQLLFLLRCWVAWGTNDEIRKFISRWETVELLVLVELLFP
ncbi:MAG: hypothetical protein K0Q55_2316, partial [Verrucomicrobia bacterium]|nr:hypothetical protein [Verrucomicrobiota bacterium]